MNERRNWKKNKVVRNYIETDNAIKGIKMAFLEYITEARGSGYDDEHATAHLWNHVINAKNAKTLIGHKNSDQIKNEIEKARENPNHPLNVQNAPHAGHTGGKINHDAYYAELQHAASTVHSLANHPSFKNAVKLKLEAKVAGSSRAKVSPLWQKNGAKNATSKADIVIGSRESGEHHPISLKKGDSQLMSAQPEEFVATYDHATNEHMRTNPSFTQAHKNKIMNAIREVGKHMQKMKGKKPAAQGKLREEAQEVVTAIHKAHPGLLKHVHFEAATGHGKFGYGEEGTARHLVTSMPDGAYIHDTLTGHEPIIAGVPRIALPKGEGRPGNAKIDYKAMRAK